MPREIWKLLLSSGSGRVGLAFFLALVAISLYVVMTYPRDFGLSRWNNPAYWADNPRNAPPSWVGLLGQKGSTPHRVWEQSRPQNTVPAGEGQVLSYIFAFSLRDSEVPSLLS